MLKGKFCVMPQHYDDGDTPIWLQMEILTSKDTLICNYIYIYVDIDIDEYFSCVYICTMYIHRYLDR